MHLSRLLILPALLFCGVAPGCAGKAVPAPTTAPSPPVAEPAPADPLVPASEPVEPIALDIQAALDRPGLPAGAASTRVVRLRIAAPRRAEQSRPRANITLVIDTSSSMQGDAIAQARQAALTVVDDLRSGDVLSVVTFGSEATVVTPPTALGDDTRPKVRAAIETIEPLGTTDLAGGLQMGLHLAQQMRADGEINRMVLLSDGVPNDEAPILGLAQAARNSAIAVTTLGLGLEFHETLLGQIAANSGGRFHFVEEPAQVAAVLEREVLSIDRIAAAGVGVTLTPGPGVSIGQVFGHSGGANGRQRLISLPDLAEGQQYDMLVELAVGEHREGATVELLDAQVTFADGQLRQAVSQRAFVAAPAVEPEVAERDKNVEVHVAAKRARVALVLLHVVQMARSGDPKGARRLLDETVKAAKKVNKDNPDAELARLIDDLIELRPTLAGLAPPPIVPQKRSKPGKAPAGTPMAQPKHKAPVALSADQARAVRSGHDRAFQLVNGG